MAECPYDVADPPNHVSIVKDTDDPCVAPNNLVSIEIGDDFSSKVRINSIVLVLLIKLEFTDSMKPNNALLNS